VYFKLHGTVVQCPDSIGRWKKAGTATDGTSPFYKRNSTDYDHITIPWNLNLDCDGHIHYTAKGKTGVYVPGVGLQYRVFKFDFEVRNDGWLIETTRGGLNKDRNIFTLTGIQTAAQRTDTKVSNDIDASREWDKIKIDRNVFDRVKEFWEAVEVAQWLVDRSYLVPPQRPVCVVAANPIHDLEGRVQTELQNLENVAKTSGLRIFVLGANPAIITKTFDLGERLVKSGYRLRVTPLFNAGRDEVQIHFQ
jgi:hypothetical protein